MVGVPEGDALSVLVATLFGVVWCESTAVPTAYVDNLDVVAKTGQDLEHAAGVMSKITETWGLTFDLGKSWCWDVGFDKEDKLSLKIQRKSCGKNLGAPMTYNKHPPNSVQVSRIQGVYNRITRLGPLQITDEQKCRLIKTGIWPAALYGAEITYLGKQWYVTLRDLVATALNKCHKWANRSMALFLYDSELDPFITLNQIKQARRALYGQDQAITHANQVLSGQYSFHLPYGPMSALQWHLLNLGFRTV